MIRLFLVAVVFVGAPAWAGFRDCERHLIIAPPLRDYLTQTPSSPIELVKGSDGFNRLRWQQQVPRAHQTISDSHRDLVDQYQDLSKTKPRFWKQEEFHFFSKLVGFISEQGVALRTLRTGFSWSKKPLFLGLPSDEFRFDDLAKGDSQMANGKLGFLKNLRGVLKDFYGHDLAMRWEYIHPRTRDTIAAVDGYSMILYLDWESIQFARPSESLFHELIHAKADWSIRQGRPFLWASYFTPAKTDLAHVELVEDQEQRLGYDSPWCLEEVPAYLVDESLSLSSYVRDFHSIEIDRLAFVAYRRTLRWVNIIIPYLESFAKSETQAKLVKPSFFTKHPVMKLESDLGHELTVQLRHPDAGGLSDIDLQTVMRSWLIRTLASMHDIEAHIYDVRYRLQRAVDARERGQIAEMDEQLRFVERLSVSAIGLLEKSEQAHQQILSAQGFDRFSR